MTPDQIKALEAIHPHYEKFKKSGNWYLKHEEVVKLKETARSFGMEVSNECMSCVPDLVIRLMRHQYLPYLKNQAAAPEVKTKTKTKK
jgi:hypothetical protein